MNRSLLVLIGAVAACTVASAAPVTEYREIFPASGSVDQAITSTGWTAARATAGGTPTILGGTPLSWRTGKPTDALPVNSGGTTAVSAGFLAFDGGVGGSFLISTDEHPFTLNASKSLDSISWYQGNNYSGGAYYMHAALKIDGTWYASDNVATNPYVSGGADFGSTTVGVNSAVERTVSLSTATWSLINSDLTIGAAATLPTSGNVQAFGILTTTPNQYFRFDSYTVNAVPEPATLGLLLTSGALLIRRKRA